MVIDLHALPYRQLETFSSYTSQWLMRYLKEVKLKRVKEGKMRRKK